ncbi:Synaptosomal-associated protein [Homalodisca vitripennis]|nr:Synaptosomal-associated protein [Homalodisca vitripennis]
MSGSQYLSNTKSSLFSVEDDVDDEEFLRHPPSGRSGYMINNGQSSYSNNLQDLHQQRLETQREIQSRIVQTSQRSLSLLRNSEEIGVSTAEVHGRKGLDAGLCLRRIHNQGLRRAVMATVHELLRQREQLERTEKRLDEINTTLRFSQKHIQGIKSAFGSFKNYLSGKTGEAQSARPKSESSSTLSSPMLLDAVEKTKPFAGSSSQDHPGLRVRGLVEEPSSSYADKNDPEKQINENLNEMVHSITRLKGLAYGLGEEIDSQNDLVENIISKTERADITLQRQNKDMTRLLK